MSIKKEKKNYLKIFAKQFKEDKWVKILTLCIPAMLVVFVLQLLNVL